MRGARLVTATETEEGRAWAESKLKEITGGDTITARFMHQNWFQYRPQFKITIIGNHKPQLRNVDDAMRRRINIVPFVHKPESPDLKLEEKLKGERSAILRWAIDGCLDWQKNGLPQPKSIMSATESYIEDQNLFQQWLEEECDVEPGNQYKTATAKDLFTSWTVYAKAAGSAPGDKSRLGESLKGAKLEAWKGTGGARTWRGVRLKQPLSRNRDAD
jgi:putative DNA primase/helicase